MKIFLGFLSGVILASGVVVLADQHNQPRCPTEDSCAVDYQHGEWHITEVTP